MYERGKVKSFLLYSILKNEKYDNNFSLILLLVSNSIRMFCFIVLFKNRFNKLVLKLLLCFKISLYKKNITSQFVLAITNSSLFVFIGKKISPKISFDLRVSIIVLFPFLSYLIISAFPFFKIHI